MTTERSPRRPSPWLRASSVLGRPADWQLRMPWIRRPRVALHWLGPLAVTASVFGSWFAFDGVTGLTPASAFSMWVGAGSILLMAWSFILALRLPFLERFWGGLDSMYRGHRWAGALAIPLMFLHTQIEPRTKGADVIAGASGNIANAAEDLAETGELMLYALIAVSLLRFIPYRWWKWTHKLFGLPFAFASWHFYTATKPYANGSPWGWWFTSFMLAGLGAYVARVFVRDTVGQGSKYTIVAAEHTDGLTRIEMEPKGVPLEFEAGQFAFLRVGRKGMREPHPFSIASPPDATNLTFYVRHLGDWSDRLPATDLIGTTVAVEGPYGAFEPTSHSLDQTVWIAGGVGITPFLAALGETTLGGPRPTVLYAHKSADGDPLVALLKAAEADGRINLRLFCSPDRLTSATLDELFPAGMANHHVALCGPESLVKDMAQAAHARGARSIETEDFDMRQGFGPERSRQVAAIADRLKGQLAISGKAASVSGASQS